MTAIDMSVVDTVITSRKSVRAYKKDAVSPELLRHLLEMAMHAPSTTNTQPWKVYVLTGAALKRLTDAVCAAFDKEAEKHRSEYAYYPDKPLEPYLSRRRKLGAPLSEQNQRIADPAQLLRQRQIGIQLRLIEHPIHLGTDQTLQTAPFLFRLTARHKEHQLIAAPVGGVENYIDHSGKIGIPHTADYKSDHLRPSLRQRLRGKTGTVAELLDGAIDPFLRLRLKPGRRIPVEIHRHQ